MTKTWQDNDVTDRIGVVNVENETELPDQSDREWFMTKTKQDNNLIDCIGLVYVDIEIEPSGSMWSGYSLWWKLDRTMT